MLRSAAGITLHRGVAKLCRRNVAQAAIFVPLVRLEVNTSQAAELVSMNSDDDAVFVGKRIRHGSKAWRRVDHPQTWL